MFEDMHFNFKNFRGQQFGNLIAYDLTNDRRRIGRNYVWQCYCMACGGFVDVPNNNLVTGNTKSCGCVGNRTHGHTVRQQSHTYNSWQMMNQRCHNPKATEFKNYGGRGITVCDRWKDFKNFLADMGERPEGTSIDRINNDGNYEPGNCRWASRAVQNSNRRKKAA